MRPRLSYANVVATIALFAAMGGGAYAAFRVPADSVGTKQLKDDAVVTSKVKDGNLRAKDFAAGQLSPRAYAVYDPATDSLLPGQTKKLTLDGEPSQGTYCLKPGKGIDVAKTAPLVSADRRLNGAYTDLPLATTIEPSVNVDCPSTDLIVQTFHYSSGSVSISGGLAFHVVVP